jgi:hypothetical protein
MRIKQMAVLSLLAVIVWGCAGSASLMNDLNVGMTKAEVIDIMGVPDYTSAKADTEILCYRLTADGVFKDSYYVIIKQGTVDRFGRQGDFGIYY